MRWLSIGALAIATAFLGRWLWQRQRTAALPDGIVVANGRLEAIEVDVATKFAGRIAEVLLDEGDKVTAGQVVARMDTSALRAALRESEAQVESAKRGKLTATAVLGARRTASATASALLPQRQGELSLAQEQFDRSRALAAAGSIPQLQLDQDRTRLDGAKAQLAVAESQAQETENAIAIAKSEGSGAEAQLAVAVAASERIEQDLADSELKSPRNGRVQHRLAQPGEVLGAGGKVLEVTDVTDVYMTVFLPEVVAGALAIGQDARIVLDAAPSYVIPSKVSYVAADAQFTPKTVETSNEREKLVFEVKVRIDPALLEKYSSLVKTGLPGVAYVSARCDALWPASLAVKLPPIPYAQQ